MYTDKITRESILLRALSNIKRNGENQSDTGVTRLIWEQEGRLSMSFDSSWKESFRTPVKRITFYGDKFFVESNHSRYEVSCREPDGLWHGPTPGTITLGYIEGKFLDSTLAELDGIRGEEASLEVIAESGSNADVYAIMTLNGMSYSLRKIYFEVAPVDFGTKGEYIYVLTLYTPRNCYRMVVKRGA